MAEFVSMTNHPANDVIAQLVLVPKHSRESPGKDFRVILQAEIGLSLTAKMSPGYQKVSFWTGKGNEKTRFQNKPDARVTAQGQLFWPVTTLLI